MHVSGLPLNFAFCLGKRANIKNTYRAIAHSFPKYLLYAGALGFGFSGE